MEMAKGICRLADLDPDAQPEDLLEGAREDFKGVACLEQNNPDSFAYFLYTLYGVKNREDRRNWSDIRLPNHLFEHHFLDVTGDEDA